ncbi:MAG: guanylate kinase [Lachnospiraceae bacterium]|nr:guanylate kinase [Lachnospiraceae bacterium]
MAERGVLTVVSGFAGSGKGTVVSELLSRYDNYALSISATTRSPREGEEEGVHYFFVSREKFEEMIENGDLLEHACYVSNYYGTPKSYVEKMLSEGKDVILEIECQGAVSVKERFPDTLLIFIMPPEAQEIYNRLKKRGTETEEVIMKRMQRSFEEASYIERYDYLVINDDLEACIGSIHGIIRSAHFKVDRCAEKIDNIKDGLKVFLDK